MRKGNRLLNLLIIILILILIGFLTYIYNLKFIPTKNKAFTPVENEVLAQAKLNDVDMQYKLLKEETAKQNKMISLEGDRIINCQYELSGIDLKYTKGNMIGFLVDKLNEMGSKSLSITTSYHYTYCYNLNDLDIVVQDNKLYIMLYDYNIELQPLAEDVTKRVITTEKGLLTKQFSLKQIDAMMKMTQIHSENVIKGDVVIIDKVLENTKSNIQVLCDRLNVDATIIISPYTPPIENNEVEVISDSNIN